jgi:uncharacterized RDD family membrane protein YckC
MRCAWARWAFVFIVLCGLPGITRAAEPQNVLVAAASDNHLWFVVAGAKGMDLCHHAPSLGGPYFLRQASLPEAPAALAAWGDRLWLVFHAKRDRREPRREVFSLRILFNPTLGNWYALPTDRLEPAGSLPGIGRLAGFVATPQGPVALLVPDQRALSGVIAENGTLAAEPNLSAPQLLAWHGGDWKAVPLPNGAGLGESPRLAATGSTNRELCILTQVPDSSNQSLLYQSSIDEGIWTSSKVPLKFFDIVRFFSAMGQPMVALEQPGQNGDLTRMQIGYVRSSGVLALAELPRPAVPFELVGLDNRLKLVERTATVMTIQSIDPMSGVLGPVETMEVQPVGGKLWQVSLVSAVVVSAILLVFLVRPVSSTPVTLPRGLQVAGMAQRLTALAIDFAPGAAIAMATLGCTPLDLLQMPVMSMSFASGSPYLLMALVTSAHSTATEMVTGASVGKLIAGIRAASTTGERPGLRNLLVRNAVKFVSLMLPPLAMVALLNPHLQGLHDLVAKTIVVRTVSEHESAESQDSD